MARLSVQRGQSLAEFALIAPLVFATLFGIIVLGLWVFYQQQVTNVAREAARFAAIHSESAPCPTVGWRDPNPATFGSYSRCDPPPWPDMTAHARSSVWGMNPSSIMVNACWSGYVAPGTAVPSDGNLGPPFPQADRPAVEDHGGGPVSNQFVQCKIAGYDPTTELSSLGCSAGMTTSADDPASNKATNQVTVYACFQWSPPLAGFLVIPSSVTMRAQITEVVQRQQ